MLSPNKALPFFLSAQMLAIPAFAQSQAAQNMQYGYQKTAPRAKVKELIQLVTDKKVQTVDELLSRLPHSMLTQYVLIYESNSLQYADPYNPRVALFSPQADFILTFTCAPSDCFDRLQGKILPNGILQAGFDSVEYVWFDWKTSQFNFGSRKYLGEMAKTADRNQNFSALGGFDLSRENAPQNCFACHGGRSSPRPNWDPYRFWKGTFGENDDGLSIDEGSQSSSAHLSRFITSAKDRPRYRHLKNLQQNFTRDLKLSKGTVYRGELNSLFTERVGTLNFMRILADLQKHPHYRTFLPLVIATIAAYENRSSLKEYFPGKVIPEEVLRCLRNSPDANDPLAPLFYRDFSILRAILKSSGTLTGIWDMIYRGRPDFEAFYQKTLFGPFGIPGNLRVSMLDLIYLKETDEVLKLVPQFRKGKELADFPMEAIHEESRRRIQKAVNKKTLVWKQICF